MKTTNQTTGRFPDAFTMILYIAAVAALGFLNCCFIKAGDPENDTDRADRLEAAAKVQSEPDIQLEDWMIDPSYWVIPDYLVVEKEEEPVLEDWMLDPAYFAVPDYLVVEKEEEPELEDWMLDPAYFAVPDYLIVEKEEEPELEDWMLDYRYFTVESLIIAKN